MSFNVKGITIEIGADATKLTDELKKIERSYSGLSKLQSSLKNSSFFDGKYIGGIQTTVIQQQLLANQIKKTSAEIVAQSTSLQNFAANVDEWKSKLASAQSKMAQLTVSMETQKEAVQSAKNAYTFASDTLAKYTARFQATSSAISSHETQLASLSKEYNSLQTAIQQESAVQDQLWSKIEKESASRNRLTTSLDQEKNKLSILRQEKAQLQAKYDEAHAKLVQAQNDNTTTAETLSRLEQAEQKAKIALEKKNAAIQKAENAIKLYSDKIKESQTKENQWLSALEKSEAKVTSYKATLEKLGTEKKELESKIQKLTAQQEKERTAMEKAGRVAQTAKENYEKQKNTLKQMETQYNKLKVTEQKYSSMLENEEKSLTSLRAQYQTNVNEMQALIIQYQELMVSMSPVVSGLNNMSTALINTGTALNTVSNATRILSLAGIAGLTGSISTAIDFESAWTGVTKTVIGTEGQLERVNEGLKNLATSTGTAYEDIAKYAELGGQMGVATDDIVQFTEVITKLGDTTNIAGEEAAQTLAKFANVMADSNDSMDYFERLGSTIVDLGNNFATTESDIMDMSMKLAAAANQSGMSSQQVLALSTALSSVGLKSAEAGGSISKMLQTISKSVALGSEDLEAYAETAGMTAEQFATAWRDDAGSAFLQFIDGLNSADDASETLVKLNELGLDTEIRLTRSLGNLASGVDQYKDALSLASDAWESNSAMNIEAEKRYGTLESTIGKTKEAIKQCADSLGKSMTPIVQDVCKTIQNLCKQFNSLTDEQKQNIVKWTAIAAAISPVSKILGATSTALGNLAGAGAKAVASMYKGNSVWTSLAKVTGTYEKAVSKSLQPSSRMVTVLGRLAGSGNQTANAVEGVAEAVTASGTAANSSSVSFLGLIKSFGTMGVAVAGVTAGVIALTAAVLIEKKRRAEAAKKTAEQELALDNVYQAQLKINEACDEYNEKAQQSIENAEDILAESEVNREYARDQFNIISALVDKQAELGEHQQLSTIEQELLNNAVAELNALFPDLGLSIDENTGRVMKQNGEIINSQDEVKQLADEWDKVLAKQAYQDAAKEYLQAVISAKVALEGNATSAAEMQKALSGAREELQGLEDKKNSLSFGQWLSDEDTARMDALKAKINLIEADLEDTAKTGAESFDTLTKAFVDNAKVMEDAYDFETVKSSLQSVVEEAEKVSIEIPQAVKDGLMNAQSGSDIDYQQFAVYKALTDLVNSAQTEGQKTWYQFAAGLASSADNSYDAQQIIENACKFSDIPLSAEKFGQEAVELLMTALLNGTTGTKEAVTELANAVNSGDYAQGLNNMVSATDGAMNELVLKLATTALESNQITSEQASAIVENISSKMATLPSNCEEPLNTLLALIEQTAQESNDALSKTGEGVGSNIEAKIIPANKSALNAFAKEALSSSTQWTSNLNSGLSSAPAKVAAVMTQANAKVKSGTTTMTSTAKSGAIAIGQALGSGSGVAGSAISTMMSVANTVLNSGLSRMLAQAQSMSSKIRAEIDSAVNYAKNNPIVVTTVNKTEKTDRDAGSVMRLMNASVDPVALMDNTETQLVVHSMAQSTQSSPSMAVLAGSLSGIQMQLSALSQALDLGQSERYLAYIANHIGGDIVLDGRKMGYYTAPGVSERQDRETRISTMLSGVRQ